MKTDPPQRRALPIAAAGFAGRTGLALGRLIRAVWLWLLRWGLVVLGGVIVIIGLLLGPLPGPGGIPIIAVGLILILRGSVTAKRGFVRLHRRYPRFVGPFRRVLRWRWRRSSPGPTKP